MSLVEAQTEPKQVRPPRIPKRIRQVVELLARGRVATQKAASDMVGLTPEHVCKSLRKPHVQAFLAQRQREIVAIGGIRAAARLVELVDADSEHVSLHASVQTLRINGVMPPDSAGTQLNVNVQPGYVINLGRSDEAEAAPLIQHQPQNDPNPLIQHDVVPDER